ncbi:MAG: hypothetical protein CMF35_13635 [Leeuwenhoekiella sp.]|jgi:hypothetical protein|uniref:C1q-like domain-containing protein n=1 Tax=Leeuwenhoekiella TaxID=283735 RepID=UPI000C6553AE|nr:MULTISPECIES: hypothetical protein [Leeuwenhoekiella]MAO45121.1 hypothetical protein [Leeuwenhoekiella sp.]MBQ52701.1 hypothetical protein [Leeuwenhoekiella sp.]HBT11311.1 hypothetical protein [Leeuwenhoekiella sp.]HCW63609.1 hypothetical protein [Leeuwenhoekiella sp.]|tara:strand:- start:32127 stop:32822 length:696 start_codon:yes stop_codon:yes gene_type:complete
MLKQILFSILFLTTFSLQAQVGVGTTDPHPDVMLDVNGGLRIRSHNEGSDDAAKDSLVVLDGRGVVHRIATSTLLANMDKSLVRAGVSTSSGALVDIGVSGEKRVKFDNESFDVKGEYDNSTGIFTAAASGIYRITAQLRSSSSLLSAGDFGIAIYKNDSGRTTYTKIAEERYLNVEVTLIKVSPPVRSVSTLVQLTAGEEITFRSITALSLTLAGTTNGNSTFMTIEQVR